MPELRKESLSQIRTPPVFAATWHGAKNLIYFRMNKFLPLVFLVVILALLAPFSAFAQMEKAEMDRIAHGKITKNQAQHLVLNKYPGAKIISCDEATANGHLMWKVRFTVTGSNLAERVDVDEDTGKITR